MKRLFAFAICAVLLLAMPVFAAAESRVNVTGTGLSLQAPEGYYVFTCDTPHEYEGWSELGLDPDTLIQYFQDNGIYFNAIEADASREIVITQVTGEEQEYIFNYALYEDETLSEAFDNLVEEFSTIGAETEEMKLYSSGAAKYIYFEFHREMDGQPVHSLMYSTIYNGKTLNFTIHVYTGAIGEYEHELLRDMVDSVVFDEKLEPSGKIYADKLQSKGVDGNTVLAGTVKGALGGAAIGGIIALTAGRKKKKQAKEKHEAGSGFDSEA